ncbi:hypothetical protein K474DRAFT_1661807 [Panus rudis PR-1116 ss-1]|nr:hypothetical protein K474DRAFT_1661807 [Panus rudis PR-1116 ss-1]
MQALRLSVSRYTLRAHRNANCSKNTVLVHGRCLNTSHPRKDADAQPTPNAAPAAPSPSNVKGKQKQTKDATDKVLSDMNKGDEIPLLSRPLGVKRRPTTEPSSWKDNMMDQEVRMEQRQKLVKEATKGYFTDLNATRRHGGKTWIAPRVLIREDKALYFPDISGSTLISGEKAHTTTLCAGKVSVISMLSSKISEIQTAMFTEPTNAAYASNPAYQHIQINLQENLLKSFLVSLFTSSIRKAIPESQWGHYLVSSQNMDYIRDDLGMTNRHIGYVYLIDQACRVRWAGCADPKPEEIEALKACTGVLLKRQDAKASKVVAPIL